jgi:hypothetical protein
MIGCLPCERARELLDDFVDDELSVADQVAVESHLRCCRVCLARVEDLRVIGASLRFGSEATQKGADRQALAGRVADALLRAQLERASAVTARARRLCQDMRLVLPALGATAALLLSVSGALAVLRVATEERPESLAAMIETLANNPLTPDAAVSFETPARLGRPFENRFSGGISLPRVIGDGTALERVREDNGAVLAVATVVNHEGRVTNYELLRSLAATPRRGQAPGQIEAAVLDAVRHSRFEPAQTPTGRPVAVNMVWVMIHQTVKGDPVAASSELPPAPKPAAANSGLPINQRSSVRPNLTTA